MALSYFDTSALVPLVVAEATTARCEQEWENAELIVTTSLAYVEVHAALAQAVRVGRLTPDGHARALRAFASRWEDVVAIHPREEILHRAATLAATHALRGYDAVHAATAVAAASDDFVALSGDRELLRAWGELGIHTIDTGV